ncbi:MAG: DASS family sodium-coupled anion symporter [Proteobacteria bacterium]|nr:DASS family sodium-coupled anion symporter [Pseudomonadota bacterium]
MNVVIDRRPLWVIILVKGFRYLVLASLGIATYALSQFEPPQGLTQEGLRAITIFALSIILWATHLLPLAITSLLAIALIALMGVMSSQEVYSLFGNSAIFFIMGALILAAGMLKTGLSSRLALIIITLFGKNSRSLVLGIFLTSAFLSFWMPEHAVAAMMFPIVLDIARGLELKPMQSLYAKALFIALAWGAIIGGVATFLGGARTPLAIGILQETSGKGIGFFEWMLAVVPIVVILLFVAYLILAIFFNISSEDISRARELIREKKIELGRMTYAEWMVGLIMTITVLLWMFCSESLGLANIALISVVALFVFKLVTWKDMEEYVNWGIILMYGGAICLGYAITDSGAALWAGNIMIGSWATSSMAMVVIFAVLAIVLTEGVSNTAIVAILLPLGISLSDNYGIDPKLVTYVVAVPAGLAFMLPMGTPPTAIALSSGYLKVKDLLIHGLILKIAAIIIFILMVTYYWPIIGMKVS